MSYSNSAVPRPNEAGSGGRGIYCCVPICGLPNMTIIKLKPT